MASNDTAGNGTPSLTVARMHVFAASVAPTFTILMCQPLKTVAWAKDRAVLS